VKALTLHDFDAPVLREDLPAPTAAANEVLVRVRASSVNPADNSIAAGMLKKMGSSTSSPSSSAATTPALASRRLTL
jgi:NADPH:quinone reductase-like Zn-dependent oxidoreductase